MRGWTMFRDRIGRVKGVSRDRDFEGLRSSPAGR